MHGVDALVTDVPEVCIAVSTADCVPVLLYAPNVKAVAAVHAGWRGTVLRIAGKTVRILMDEYGADPRLMKAGIAPSIGPEAFEVGEEVVDAFREAGFEMSCILKRDADTGKAHIDLWEANRLQLLTEGLSVGNIELAGICTYDPIPTSSSPPVVWESKAGVSCPVFSCVVPPCLYNKGLLQNGCFSSDFS